MTNDKKLQAAVEFLLDEHLKGEPSDAETSRKFAVARSHREALATEDKAEAAAAQVEAQEAPATVPVAAPVVPSVPQIPKA